MQWSKSSRAAYVVAALLLGSSSAYGQTAQETKAEELFNKAVELSESRKYREACPLLVESHKLDPRASTLFAIADCEREAKQIASSVAHFKDYLGAYEALKGDTRKRHDQRASSARAYIKTLEPKIPTLTFTFPDGIPLEFTLARNGNALERISLDRELPVDPGEHVIILKVPGRQDTEQRVTIAEKQKKVVELAPGAAIVQDTLDKDKGSIHARKKAGIAILGVGAAGLVFGGVMGGLAVGQKGVVTEHCKGLDCDPIGLDAVKHGRSFGNMSTIGLAAGGVLAATGLVLVLTAPKSKPKTGWITGVGGSASREGAFLSAEGWF